MSTVAEVQTVSDSEGRPIGVFVPIDVWRDIESELETAFVLRSDAMRTRLLAAKERSGGFTLEEVRAQLDL